MIKGGINGIEDKLDKISQDTVMIATQLAKININLEKLLQYGLTIKK